MFFFWPIFAPQGQQKKKKKEKRKCEVYKGLLLSPILGVMFFFWPNFAPQQQKKQKKNVMCIKRL